jgi:hypothetical protein
MAQPSTELVNYRERVTSILNALYQEVQAAIDVVDGTGTNEGQRRAFFQEFFDTHPDYDIDLNELFASVTSMRTLRTWVEANMAELAKMRI